MLLPRKMLGKTRTCPRIPLVVRPAVGRPLPEALGPDPRLCSIQLCQCRRLEQAHRQGCAPVAATAAAGYRCRPRAALQRGGGLSRLNIGRKLDFAELLSQTACAPHLWAWRRSVELKWRPRGRRRMRGSLVEGQPVHRLADAASPSAVPATDGCAQVGLPPLCRLGRPRSGPAIRSWARCARGARVLPLAERACGQSPRRT